MLTGLDNRPEGSDDELARYISWWNWRLYLQRIEDYKEGKFKWQTCSTTEQIEKLIR